MERKKILVVDDQLHNVLLLKTRLEKAGFNVLEAYDGEEALDITMKEIPDLILLDIMMPNISGYEVCEKIVSNEKTKDIPVILVTALTKPEDVKRGYEVGAFDYVKKPYNITELLRRVNYALRLSESAIVIKELRNLKGFLENIKLNNEKLKKLIALIKQEISEVEMKSAEASVTEEFLKLKVKKISDYLSELELIINNSPVGDFNDLISRINNYN